MNEDFSDFFPSKRLFDVRLEYKDREADSLVKKMRLGFRRNRLDPGRPLSASDLQDLHSTSLFWQTALGARARLDSEITLQHASNVKLTYHHDFEDFALKLAAAFNSRVASQNFYTCKLKHSFTSQSQLILWLKKMAVSNNDTLKVFLKTKGRFEPFFDKLLLDLTFINKVGNSELECQARFFTETRMGRFVRYGFQCEASSQHLTRPKLKLSLRYTDLANLWLQALWGLDLARGQNYLAFVGKLVIASDLAVYGKLSSQQEAYFSLAYRPWQGVSLIQSVRVNWQDILSNKGGVSCGIGIKVSV